MIDNLSLLRLQAWLSPSFPTGAFSYSHGLEQAVSANKVHDEESLYQWISSLINYGTGWNDSVLLAESWRRSTEGKNLVEISELAQAMTISKERHLETMAQGSAFMKAACAWEKNGKPPVDPNQALPVAIGHYAAIYGIALQPILAVFLQAFISNQIQAALRLVRIGQQSGVYILARLEPELLVLAKRASTSSLGDLGSAGLAADIVAMQHETLENRIFRS